MLCIRHHANELLLLFNLLLAQPKNITDIMFKKSKSLNFFEQHFAAICLNRVTRGISFSVHVLYSLSIKVC